MKNNIAILALCLFCQVIMGQSLTRKSLHGQILNDSIKLDNVLVFNVNTKMGTLTESSGFFSILAKANDTLVFSSISFKSKKIVLSERQASAPLIRVKLDAFANILSEVIVPAKREFKLLSGNSQAIVDRQYTDDLKTSPKNRLMPADGSIEYGMNFVRIYKEVIKTLQKNNPELIDITQNKSFTEQAITRVGYDFFVNTLQLNDDEIRLFLIFCENDSKAKSLLRQETEFQLIEFLINKNKEYKQISASAK